MTAQSSLKGRDTAFLPSQGEGQDGGGVNRYSHAAFFGGTENAPAFFSLFT